jgi:hypothetical protein
LLLSSNWLNQEYCQRLKMASNLPSFPSTRVDNPLPDSTATKHVTSLLDRSYELLLHEEIWRDRYLFFLDRGLELRPRYRPGWIPSWLGTNMIPEYCEDSKKKTVSFCSILIVFSWRFMLASSSFRCQETRG